MATSSGRPACRRESGVRTSCRRYDEGINALYCGPKRPSTALPRDDDRMHAEGHGMVIRNVSGLGIPGTYKRHDRPSVDNQAPLVSRLGSDRMDPLDAVCHATQSSVLSRFVDAMPPSLVATSNSSSSHLGTSTFSILISPPMTRYTSKYRSKSERATPQRSERARISMKP